MIQGFTGQLDMWLSRGAFEPTFVERLDAMFAAGDCPDAVIVFVDAWTSLGGSQFLNSAGTGRYMDYLCDEVVPFVDERYPTSADRDHRGLRRQVVGRLRRDGRADAAPGRVRRARLARRRRAVRVLLPARVPAHRRGRCATTSTARARCSTSAWRPPTTSTSTASAARSMMYAMRVRVLAGSASVRGRPAVPFEIATGKLIDEIWAAVARATTRSGWLPSTPTRCRACAGSTSTPGARDEWYLDLGAQAFAHELDKLGVEYTLELFDGRTAGSRTDIQARSESWCTALRP